MQVSIVFLVRVQCRCKESSRSLSHLMMSFLFLLGGLGLEVYLVVLDRLLRATTKKRSSTFCTEKVHPQTKSWLRLSYLNIRRG